MSLSTSGRAPRLRPKNSLRTELPLILALVLGWGALWQDFSPGMLIFGLILAWALTKVFYLPPVRFSGRFNPLWGLWFLLRFLWWVILGSLEVLWLAFRPGPAPRSAVMSAQLRVEDDLLLTTVGGIISLIPGSLVLEVDRRNGTIYFHVLNVTEQRGAEKFRAQARKVEELLILTVGSRELSREVLRERREEERG